MKPLILLAFLASLPNLGCDKGSSGQGSPKPAVATSSVAGEKDLSQPVAKIDDTVITLGDFQDRINKQSPYIRARYASVEQKKEFLDSLIRFEILAKEAYRRGLDKEPEAVMALKQVMIQKLMREQFDDSIDPATIPQSEVEAYYKAHPEEFHKPEQMRVSAIIVKDKKIADKAAARAMGIDGRSNKGYRDLVAEYTIDAAGKENGGDLKYFSRDDKNIPQPVIEAAFGLREIGQVVGPIDAGNGTFYILKQTGKFAAIDKTLDQATRQIQNTLWKDKRQSAQTEFLDKLRSNAKIEIDESALAKVKIDTSMKGAENDPHGHPHAEMAPVPSQPSAPAELSKPTTPDKSTPTSAQPGAAAPKAEPDKTGTP